MQPSIQALDQHNLAAFIQYCSDYGCQHDESYLPGADFEPSAEQPTYVLYQDGNIRGVVSLIRKPAYLQAHKGRFAIFHAKTPNLEHYQMLSQAISAHFNSLERVYLFIPQDKKDSLQVFVQMGYERERISYVLHQRQPQAKAVNFTSPYRIASFEIQDQRGLGDFCTVINRSFRKSAGHVELSLDDIRGWFNDKTYLPGGMFVLYDSQQPVGSVAILRDMDEETSSEIISLGVVEDYRGRGLGRQLLCSGINFSIEQHLKSIYLSVNGENDSAIRLYESEGFETIKKVVCLAKKVAG